MCLHSLPCPVPPFKDDKTGKQKTKGADQPAHPRAHPGSMISAFMFRFLQAMVSKLSPYIV